MATVFEAIAEGQITPGEGEILANILAVPNEVVATSDLQDRVEHLEVFNVAGDVIIEPSENLLAIGMDFVKYRVESGPVRRGRFRHLGPGW